jgi:hypothetical protein
MNTTLNVLYYDYHKLDELVSVDFAAALESDRFEAFVQRERVEQDVRVFEIKVLKVQQLDRRICCERRSEVSINVT